MLIIGEASQAMLAQAGCEQYDWPYAISYAAYLSNITPTKGLNNDITPNEAYDGVHREYKVEGVFGCLCYAKVFARRKAEPKARVAVLILVLPVCTKLLSFATLLPLLKARKCSTQGMSGLTSRCFQTKMFCASSSFVPC